MLTRQWEVLHMSRSQEKNMPSLHPSSRQRSVSTPHCTATRQLSVIFRSSWGVEMKVSSVQTWKGKDVAERMRNLKIRNFILKASRSFMRKFAPTKISRYTVLSESILNDWTVAHGCANLSHMSSISTSSSTAIFGESDTTRGYCLIDATSDTGVNMILAGSASILPIPASFTNIGLYYGRPRYITSSVSYHCVYTLLTVTN